MKLHERFMPVQRAEVEFGSYLLELEKKYNLTEWELIGILLGEAMTIKKYAIRAERHPSKPDSPGDAE